MMHVKVIDSRMVVLDDDGNYHQEYYRILRQLELNPLRELIVRGMCRNIEQRQDSDKRGDNSGGSD